MHQHLLCAVEAPLSNPAVKLDQSVDDVLAEICSRGQAAEIHYWERNEPRTARTQFIQLDDDVIRIAKPQCIGRDVVIRVGSRVTMYFPYCGEIMAFETELKNPTVVFELNRSKKIIGVEIARPQGLLRQQRRHDYRITLSRYHLNIHMHEAALATGSQLALATPIPARRMTGRMTNISAAGFGFLVPKAGCVRFKLWDLFIANFQLPETETRLWLPAQIRHARRIHDGENVQIGLRLAYQDHPDVRKQIPYLQRFIQAEQRRQLQQKKS